MAGQRKIPTAQSTTLNPGRLSGRRSWPMRSKTSPTPSRPASSPSWPSTASTANSGASSTLDCGSASCRFSEAGLGKGGSFAPVRQSPLPIDKTQWRPIIWRLGDAMKLLKSF